MIDILVESEGKFSEKAEKGFIYGMISIKNDNSPPLQLANLIAYLGLKLCLQGLTAFKLK